MRPLFAPIAAVALVVPLFPVLAQAASAPAEQNRDEQMICRKFLETGSLVKKRKVCMTKSEWARVQTSQREGSQKMIQDLTGGFQCQSNNSC